MKETAAAEESSRAARKSYKVRCARGRGARRRPMSSNAAEIATEVPLARGKRALGVSRGRAERVVCELQARVPPRSSVHAMSPPFVTAASAVDCSRLRAELCESLARTRLALCCFETRMLALALIDDEPLGPERPTVEESASAARAGASSASRLCG
jgi:hypothetical protein